MELKNKKVLILGAGKSGISAQNFLLQKGADVFLYDEKFKNYKKMIKNKFDLCVVSPGIKKADKAYAWVKENNIKIIAEVELGYLHCKGKFIGVTGTNGKTTVTEMIAHVFNTAGKKAYACGNNGVPLTSICNKVEEEDFVVLELSSYMLENFKSLHLNIALFLNFAPDHLSSYKSLGEYFSAKTNIFLNQNEDDIKIINYDDTALKDKEFNKNALYFSTKGKTNGTFVCDNEFLITLDNGEKLVLKTSEILLTGQHNYSNVCATILACYHAGLRIDEIASGLKTFTPPKHRLNFVCHFNNAKVFNDSKATNINSTLVAVDALKANHNIILILGGSDKGEDFNELFSKLDNKIKRVIITGGNAKKLISSARDCGFDKYEVYHSLKKSIRCSLAIAEDGDAVLFSPASASFDKFKNFEQRGDYFEKIVRRVIEKKK